MTAIPAVSNSSAPTPSGEPAQPPSLWAQWRRIRRSYLFRVIMQGLLTIWAVTTLTFFMIRQMPGNPLDTKVEEFVTRRNLTYEEAYRAASSLFNFDPDKPILLQYADYLGKLVQGDLGMSITKSGVSVTSIILHYLPWTLFCIGSALVISFTLGIVLGLAIGYWRGSW